MNPYLAVPFILSPLTAAIVPYVLMAFDIFPKLNSIGLPLGTPVVFNAFLQGGIMLIILQVIIFIVTTFIYYPFFKMIDKKALKEEQQSES
ncbi:hypothetical protein [Salibacterium lacus]|uniref:PTS sugar transporter subunit IIC n=1 Tax=Salibacterium lacus TaxID=1898109 RepID=A0ABW5T4M2_9BACI